MLRLLPSCSGAWVAPSTRRHLHRLVLSDVLIHQQRALSSTRAAAVQRPLLGDSGPPHNAHVHHRLPHSALFHTRAAAGFAGSTALSPSSSSGEIDFLLADIGEGIAECELLRWFVAEGDEIAQFDKVCEVQSDKANVEITSRYDGRVKELKYRVGDLAKVGAPLLTIQLATAGAGTQKPGEAQPDPVETGRAAKDYSTPVVPQGQGLSEESITAAGYPLSSVPSHRLSSVDEREVVEAARADVAVSGAEDDDGGHASAEAVELSFGKVQTSPAVRRIAKESKVDLTRVKGTGPQGRILKDDVARYSQARSPATTDRTALRASPPSVSAPPPLSAATTADRFPTVTLSPAHSPSTSPPTVSAYLTADQVIPISGLQRIMVQTMTAANLVPHFTYGEELNLDALSELREALKPQLAAQGVKVSYMPFFIKALSLALRAFPQLNAHVNADCTAVTHRAHHNVGVAMDTAKGLLVPNVKNVQSRSILDIGRELNRLQALGKAGQLTREDLQGGTITLSNIGSVGGTYCSPIIVVPEVCIAALGSMRTLPRYDEHGQVKPTKVINVSWSADHRVVDGATVARFNQLWKSLIEHPSAMLMELR